MNCAMVESGKSTRKGKASLEFFYCGRPHYYCLGYIDKMTDEYCEECKNCRSHVSHAQCDLELMNGNRKGGDE